MNESAAWSRPFKSMEWSSNSLPLSRCSRFLGFLIAAAIFSSCTLFSKEDRCDAHLLGDAIFAGRQPATEGQCPFRATVPGVDGCPLYRVVAPANHSGLVWHPEKNRNLLAFNHAPIESIEYPYGPHCQARRTMYRDAEGFWVASSDGSGMRRVSTLALPYPSWSPDGNWIAFSVEPHIYKVRFTGSCVDKSTITQLTFHGRNFLPAWSPDGRWIAYDRSLADEAGPAGIWVVDRDGKSRRHVGPGAFPDWHPSGNRIISAISDLAGGQRFIVHHFLLTARADTLPARSGATNSHPRFSPDGNQIAFASQKDGGDFNIWLMNADGSELRQLTQDGTTGSFTWSGDGRKIYYVQHRYNDWSYCTGAIRAIDVQSGHSEQITYNYLPAR
jgi:hypothetical protein